MTTLVEKDRLSRRTVCLGKAPGFIYTYNGTTRVRESTHQSYRVDQTRINFYTPSSEWKSQFPL